MTTHDTPEAVDALRALSDAASPGPWTVEATGADYYDDGDDSEVESGWFVGPKMIDRYDYETLRFEDAEFIVAAVNYVRATLESLP